jgi:DNA-binding transcriptional MerR regulator
MDRTTRAQFTVSELAAKAGVTVRTLHHYDERGIVSPSSRSEAGYRLYSPADAERLAHVLAYRACGIGLEEIRDLLDSTGDELVDHLARQKALLDERLEVMERQREALRNAWEAARMGINLGPEERLEVFGAHDPGQYADEARERWGETDAYRESHRRTSEYTKADWQRLGEESERIEQEYADCLMSGEPSDGPRARAAAERHRSHIDQWFYPCSHEMQVGLAEMYVADPRFTAHYDARVPGLAQYVHDAIYANALADGT